MTGEGMGKQKYYIGIDLGTSAVKLILADAKGNLLANVSREYPISFPKPGWSEQEPSDWMGQVEEGVRLLLAEASGQGVAAADIVGIGIGGQMHGLVILDGDDRVIRPAILWNDGRTEKECDYLNGVVGRDKLSQYTANMAFAGFTAPKLMWLKENEPENFRRINKIMLPKDYIVYCLTGVHATDYSDASGMLLLDVKNRRWSDEMLSICGIDEGQLPKLYESYQPVGHVRAEAADRLGLAHDVVVAAGAGDNAAAAVGTGTIGEGRCNISLGTSGTIFISSDTFKVDGDNALHAFAHADGHYHLMGCMLSAASCNRWWMDGILGTGDYAGEQAVIGDDDLGRNQVYFLPYLMGERSPHNDPRARGAFVGMGMDTGRKDMTQAVLEGVAYAIRDSFQIAGRLGIDITSSKICGGGAKSPLWRRIMANVLGIDIEVPAMEEGPALGGAMLAMVACGEYENVPQAVEAIVGVKEVIHPEPGLVQRYQEGYAGFTRLYPALKGVFQNMY